VAMGFDWFSWIVVPVLIFLARITDVTLGTMRFIFLGRGYRKLPALLGFFEILIWLIAIREVMVNLRNVLCIIAYAGGFSMGNYVGIWLEEKLRVGLVMLRVVFSRDSSEFAGFMKEMGNGYTLVDGKGTRERVKILFSVVKRKDLKEILDRLQSTNPHAFFTVENIKAVHEGIFPYANKTPFKMLFRKHRKSK
jgi:uncharacterized protein YebE (UPF0316 family)